MSRANPRPPTPEAKIHQLEEYFVYDRAERKLKWRKSRGNRKAGTSVGYLDSEHGYLRVFFMGRHHMIHRIVFALEHGYVPLEQVRCINGDKTDIRPENLELTGRPVYSEPKRRKMINRANLWGVPPCLNQ